MTDAPATEYERMPPCAIALRTGASPALQSSSLCLLTIPSQSCMIRTLVLVSDSRSGNLAKTRRKSRRYQATAPRLRPGHLMLLRSIACALHALAHQIIKVCDANLSGRPRS